MNTQLIALGMFAMAVSGSSCHDNGADTQQSQTTDSRTGYKIVPRQQIEPQIQPRPGM
jgi:hypothetical protein